METVSFFLPGIEMCENISYQGSDKEFLSLGRSHFLRNRQRIQHIVDQQDEFLTALLRILKKLHMGRGVNLSLVFAE